MRFILISTLAFISFSHATLQKRLVPGAKCLRGGAYSYFYRKGDPKKIIIHLGGGGACWNQSTATGLIRFCKESVLPPPTEGVFSFKEPQGLLRDYSYIYIPYCTGDAFIGSHKVQYRKKNYFYWGRANLERALEDIQKNILIKERLTDFVLIGSSAGALGSLLNFEYLAKLAPAYARKTFVADSPGLHFGTSLWSKMSRPLLLDLEKAFARLGIEYKNDSETMSYLVSNICRNNKKWTLGILQATQDRIMSFLARIPTREHEALVLGNTGIYRELSDTSDLCSSWTPRVKQHKFLSFDHAINYQTTNGITALEYLEQLLAGSQTMQRSHW